MTICRKKKWTVCCAAALSCLVAFVAKASDAYIVWEEEGYVMWMPYVIGSQGSKIEGHKATDWDKDIIHATGELTYQNTDEIGAHYLLHRTQTEGGGGHSCTYQVVVRKTPLEIAIWLGDLHLANKVSGTSIANNKCGSVGTEGGFSDRPPNRPHKGAYRGQLCHDDGKGGCREN